VRLVIRWVVMARSMLFVPGQHRNRIPQGKARDNRFFIAQGKSTKVRELDKMRFGNLTPTAYATISDAGMQQDGTLRYAGGSAPRPVASPSQQGSNEARILLIGG
jgi:hypothetical protein